MDGGMVTEEDGDILSHIGTMDSSEESCSGTAARDATHVGRKRRLATTACACRQWGPLERLVGGLLLVWLVLSPPSCLGPRGGMAMGIIPAACAASAEQSQATNSSSSGIGARALLEREPKRKLTFHEIVVKAGRKGLGGGIPGLLAGIVQVLSLMWLRTIINYQCRYGTNFREAFATLAREGGIARFYRGLWFALIQAPMSRFVSTASNDGVEFFLGSFPPTQAWGPAQTTVVASVVVGFWRIALMPIDTCKTVLQVDSLEGFRHLMRRVKAGKIGVLYQGSIALAFSAMLGHYPWFYTYNLLSKSPLVNSLITSTLLRNAGIGVAASIISDTLVNSIRVIKTMKQAVGTKHNVGYLETVRMVLAADGWKGLFGRGLQTRIYANALQSLVFTVIWRGMVDYWTRKEASNRTGAR